MADMVTMRSPDGRVIRTDVAAEINTLRSRGYTVDEEPDRGPMPEPAPAPQPPPQPVALDDDELTEGDDDE